MFITFKWKNVQKRTNIFPLDFFYNIAYDGKKSKKADYSENSVDSYFRQATV